jgi:ABC-2 type transport system permease protein
VSRANPFFYVISGFRYGFLGESDIGGADAVAVAGGGLLVLNIVMAAAVYALLRSGWKLKS